MRGASAMQAVMDEAGDPAIRAFIVWEPVILTDLAPPTSFVLARFSDTRGSQFYDEGRLLSALLRESGAPGSPGETAAGDREAFGADEIVWDHVLVYPPGARWETGLPRPAFSGGPVVSVIGRVRQTLNAYRPSGRKAPPSLPQKE